MWRGSTEEGGRKRHTPPSLRFAERTSKQPDRARLHDILASLEIMRRDVLSFDEMASLALFYWRDWR